MFERTSTYFKKKDLLIIWNLKLLRKREMEISTICSLSPQMVETARTEPNKSQESGNPFEFSTRVAGTQVLGKCSAAFTDPLAESWVRSRAARSHSSVHMEWLCHKQVLKPLLTPALASIFWNIYFWYPYRVSFYSEIILLF